MPVVSRSLWLGFHASDSYGYHFCSKPAPQRLRIPSALGMLVKYSGYSYSNGDRPRCLKSPDEFSSARKYKTSSATRPNIRLSWYVP